MQLNQPIPPPYAHGDNPYDFILNGSKKPKKSLIPSGNSRKNRILLVLGGLGVVIVVVMIIFALLSTAGSSNKKNLLALAQSQTEIIRVSTDNGSKLRDTTIQGFAQSVSMVITTNKLQTTKYMGKQKIKVNPKTLALGRSTKTDNALTAADEAGRYDDELLKILEKDLTAYKTQLSSAYKQASSKSEKTLLKELFDQAVLLTKNQPTSS